MSDYATKEQLDSFAQEGEALSSGVDDNSGWELLLTAASRLFDRLVEVEDDFFMPAPAIPEGDTVDDVATSRDFYGNGTAFLKLDPFVELAETDPVVIDEDDDLTYDLPTYVVRNGSLVVPEKTRAVNSYEFGSYLNRFTGWRDGVKVTVTARWGFEAIPSDVTIATIAIALHLWRTGTDPAFSTISNVEGAPVALPPTAQMIVDKYREKYSSRALFA